MIEEKKILSICIPTYNRANLLKSSLLSIYNQRCNYNDFEVIVSNNASTDNTSFVVKEFLNKENFTYIEQTKNVGFSGNVTRIVENAKGEFCWIVGDDDFLLPDTISEIIDLLRKEDVDFVYAKVEEIQVNEYEKYLKPFHTGMLPVTNSNNFEYFRVEKWEELLQSKYSIIFLGEVMASIFRRNIWLQYTPPNLEATYLSNLETTYTHSVIFANTFVGKSAIYIKSPVVLALSGAREWWDKVGFIVIVHVRSLLNLYSAKGVSKKIMAECWNSFIKLSVPYAIKFLFEPAIPYRDKVSLKELYRELLRHNFRLTIRTSYDEMYPEIKRSIKKFLKKIIKKDAEIPKSNYQINEEIFERNKVSIEKNFEINGEIIILNEGKIKIGKNFKGNSGVLFNMIGGDTTLRLITYMRNATLEIGSNVGISNSTIVAWNSIKIEDNVMIGGSVKIWDTNFHSLDPIIRVSSFDDNVKTAPVHIKECAFIGANTIILKGVTIGKNSIIAAGSVVSKDIPDNVVAAGNPCKVIRLL